MKINLKKIYNNLKPVYPTLGVTRKNDSIKWAELKSEHKNIPDYHLMLNLSYGPWREKRQNQVWKKVYTNFQKVGDIKDIEDISNLGFPLSWQNERVEKMRSYLRNRSINLQDFLSELNGQSGIEIRNKFREIMGGNTTKIYSTFIRDFMEMDDVFPIDSRVSSMLNKLGLPKNEELMVKLCREHEIPPTLFEGFLYRFKDEFCDKNKYVECPIKDECWCYKIEKQCCNI